VAVKEVLQQSLSEQKQITQAAFDEWVYRSPLGLAELRKQARDLEALERVDDLSPEFLDEFRGHANTVGIHPVRRGLLPQEWVNESRS